VPVDHEHFLRYQFLERPLAQFVTLQQLNYSLKLVAGHQALARIIHERSRVRESCAGGRRSCGASGFDTARRAVLKASPGRALSEGPNIGPESKPHGRTIPLGHE
jgi:hypothetical protein